LFWGCGFPWALECLACCCDGNVDILLGSFTDGADDFFGGGVDGLEGLAVDTFDKFVVDESEGKELVRCDIARCSCGRQLVRAG